MNEDPVAQELEADRDPKKLCACVRRRRLKLRRIMRRRGIATTTVETLRTPERHEILLLRKVSWTKKSKHLAQKPHGRSLAFDEGINRYFRHKLWNPAGEAWVTLGDAANAVGLLWGGTWFNHPDSPHLYLSKCLCKEDKA